MARPPGVQQEHRFPRLGQPPRGPRTEGSRADYGDALLSALRYRDDGSEDPAFILNRDPYRAAQILVTGSNFGCGSSREHAVWAVRDFGFRALIAPCFGQIFASSSVQCGFVPVVLPREDVVGRGNEEYLSVGFRRLSNGKQHDICLH